MTLDLFHPLVKEWFLSQYPAPTDIQEKGWAEIASGSHVLMTAPTGSGKTLAAFLWSLNQLIAGEWPVGMTRILYLSPLKALNNDVKRNLIEPLEKLKAYFEERGAEFPPIHVMTRSGDTSSSDRQRMVRKPPEVFITTPESLNLMLTSGAAQKMLAGVAVVILDEIHGIAGDKRGVLLFSAVERLARACGEFQRIGMSATVNPLNRVAALLGGFLPREQEEEAPRPRPVRVIPSRICKKYELDLIFPAAEPGEDSHWPAAVKSFLEKIRANRSTLVFCNSRRQTEKVTRMINESAGETVAFAHHGSLSREIRYFVEQQMKEGALKCIVATSSLEMGIDIGSIDQVLLIQAPFALSSAIQRIGRGGHKVGDVSRGAIYPMYGMDLIRCAVAGRAMLAGEIEELTIPENPLDVLAQIVLSCCCTRAWDLDELYLLMTSVWHWRHLPRRHFDLVVEMLSGRYADTRIGELKPRLTVDRVENTAVARDGAARIIYTSGGTIPDRGYYELRHHGTKAIIGELDEEFVWERNHGDFFTLGAQTWRIDAISDRAVEVTAADTGGAMSPFWKADPQGRDFFYSAKILDFMAHAETLLQDRKGGEASLTEELGSVYAMDREGAEAVVAFLQRQRTHTEGALPHGQHLLIEHFNDPLNRTDCHQIILHTLWGGKVNFPFSEALAQAWEEKNGYPLQVFCDDDAVIMDLPHRFDPEDVLSLVSADNLESLLRRRLESTLFFGGRFRHNASRALLLPRKSFKQRTPLWLTRLRSKKLMQAVSRYDDFPILTETWRSCFQDDFDMETLGRLLDEIREGRIRVTQAVTRTPSPFSADIIHAHTDQRMYEDDTPLGRGQSNLREDLIKGLVHDSGLRPRLPRELCEEFRKKVQRLHSGYAPSTAADLIDWLDERVLIPRSEWEELAEAVKADYGDEGVRAFREAEEKTVAWTPSESAQELIISQTYLAKYGAEGFLSGMETLLPQWLTFYPPLPLSSVLETYPAPAGILEDCLESLKESELLVIGRLTGDAPEEQICTAENLEILFRLKRRQGRSDFKALPLEKLTLFLAQQQLITRAGSDGGDIHQVMDRLIGYGAKAALWESEILPARLDPYFPGHLDTLFQESPLLWYGTGKETVAFCFDEEQALFIKARGKGDRIGNLLPDGRGSFSFWDIKEHTGRGSSELMDLLWKSCWEGRLSNDRLSVLRKGIQNKFKSETLNDMARKSGGRIRRGGYNRWMNTRSVEGRWHLNLSIPSDEDPIERDERLREVIRQLFQRYGVLFRQLLDRETSHMRWPGLFRTLRLMELSGECVAGQFFQGIRGLQFASWDALRTLNASLDEDFLYWMNCADPASPSGLKNEELKGRFPSRLASNHMVFRGSRPLLYSRRNGKSLTFHVGADDPDATESLYFFKTLLSRESDPLKSIRVEEINGEPYGASPYKGVLEAAGFRDNFSCLILHAPL